MRCAGRSAGRSAVGIAEPRLNPPARAVSRIHHVGMSVSDLDQAAAFWEAFLGAPPRSRTTLDRPYLGRHVGYPGVVIDAAFFELPDGALLELLDYRVPSRHRNPDASANPGHVHLCLAVDDAVAAFKHAVDCGARPVCPDGPVTVDGGPNRGAVVAYLRIPPDAATLELYQVPRA